MMLMYIPFEEVYLMAMKAEVDGTKGKMPLREWAWQNDVVFVNASGLIPLVRMLAELWDRDRSEKKVLQIKAAAESLIEKFKLFLEGAGSRKDGFLAIGTSLAQAVAAYNESVKRLSDGRGSVIKKLADLKDMGVTAAEKLPPPEQVATRQIDRSAAG
jgi:DNA recombination protein RmuC